MNIIEYISIFNYIYIIIRTLLLLLLSTIILILIIFLGDKHGTLSGSQKPSVNAFFVLYEI